ncbi:MAG: OadG family protein [Candidatus Cloacimonetes bacterium]|nr:OadG family protein [Candidatus Cloacimonadota bacterium]
MKKIMIIMFLLISLFCMAQEQKPEIFSEKTLSQLSQEINIPIKKLKTLLEIDAAKSPETKLNELEITSSQVQNAITEYNSTKRVYFWSIVLAGMIIVFISLALVGFIINQLKKLHKLDKLSKKRLEKIPRAKISADKPNLSRNDIVAVITAIYLHELEAEEQSRLLLTWKRTPISMWKAATKFNMPNRLFFGKK